MNTLHTQKSTEKPEIIKFVEKVEEKYKISIGNILANISEISFEDFKSILFRCNWIIKDYSKNERWKISDTVSIEWICIFWQNHTLYLPPKNKEVYLKALYAHLINDSLDNNQKSMMLYYGLQYIHIFSDGNRRTGRFISTLIKDWKYDKNIDWNDLLKDNLGWKKFHLPNRLEVLWEINKRTTEKYFESKNMKIPSFYTYSFNAPIEINWELKNHKNYAEAQKILDANYIGKGLNFRDVLLYLINKNHIENDDFYQERWSIAMKRKMRKDKKSKITNFSWEKVLRNATEEDLEFIVEEYKNFEEERMKIVLNPEEMEKVVKTFSCK